MKFLVYIFLVLSAGTSFAQASLADTSWFDSGWQEVSKEQASFYRTIKKSATGFIVYDHYLDGNPQMVAEAREIKPVIKDGKCNYYYKNNVRSSFGNYKDNKKTGTWVEFFNNGKDSSVTSLLEDGTKTYIRKSKYEDTFTAVEYMPEFPGGQTELIKFIQTNIVYPKNLNVFNVGGKVFLKFVVSPDGNVYDVQVIKSSGFIELDNEAKRIVELMPKWKPGMQDGKTVPVFFNLPINFSLKYPYFVYNVANASGNYQKIRSMIHDGGSPLAIAHILENESDKEKNIDVLYNLGVAYYHSNKSKKACEHFSKILKISNENITIVNNSKLFLEKHCTN